jgi:tetratricopeptide (TPR) repeat protein
MKTNNRILQIEQMLDEDPHDPFLHYARCLEYARISPKESQPLWERMLLDFPDYVPLYYQAGTCFAELGLKDQAIETWKKGVEKAAKHLDLHALTELKSILQNALIDDED